MRQLQVSSRESTHQTHFHLLNLVLQDRKLAQVLELDLIGDDNESYDSFRQLVFLNMWMHYIEHGYSNETFPDTVLRRLLRRVFNTEQGRVYWLRNSELWAQTNQKFYLAGNEEYLASLSRLRTTANNQNATTSTPRDDPYATE